MIAIKDRFIFRYIAWQAVATVFGSLWIRNHKLAYTILSLMNKLLK